MAEAILAGGCFWCLEAVYEQVRGVLSVESGYIGGAMDNPTYEAICTGTTGHAEAVRLQFDVQQVSFTELLTVFFTIHDPTQLNRQGNDVGTQYRSAIFCVDAAQQTEAEAFVQGLREAAIFSAPIVTEIVSAPQFFVAEDYHQHYYAQHPNQGYCVLVVAPKLAKFRQKLANLQTDPA